jgi:tetratricopeptide (TPR) repeat protein
MARGAQHDADRLRREVERALRNQEEPEEILHQLARLARAAEPESEEWIFAHRHLAELGVEHDPWRAALFARRVLALREDDDGAWAVLGLAQSLLGHYRYAARAYERALELSPGNPWYAHNLGHLYDVALNRPLDALPLLAQATQAETGEADIAASGATADQMALWRWLDAGAPTTGLARPSSPPETGEPSAPRKKPKRRRPRERQSLND